MGPLADHTIDSIRAGLVAKQFSAEELTREALAFAEAENPKTNAYLILSPERALAAARAVDGKLAAGEEPGALAGVPIGIKDVIVTRNLRTTCGSRMLANLFPAHVAIERGYIIWNRRGRGSRVHLIVTRNDLKQTRGIAHAA